MFRRNAIFLSAFDFTLPRSRVAKRAETSCACCCPLSSVLDFSPISEHGALLLAAPQDVSALARYTKKEAARLDRRERRYLADEGRRIDAAIAALKTRREGTAARAASRRRKSPSSPRGPKRPVSDID